MNQFAALSAKIYGNLTDNNDKDKKAKGTRNSVVKRKFCRKFKD